MQTSENKFVTFYNTAQSIIQDFKGTYVQIVDGNVCVQEQGDLMLEQSRIKLDNVKPTQVQIFGEKVTENLANYGEMNLQSKRFSIDVCAVILKYAASQVCFDLIRGVFPEVEKYDKDHKLERFDNEGRQLRRIRIGGYTVLAGFILFILCNVSIWSISKYRRKQRLSRYHKETNLKY